MQLYRIFSSNTTLRVTALFILVFTLAGSGALQKIEAQSLDRFERERAQQMLKVVKDEIKKKITLNPYGAK